MVQITRIDHIVLNVENIEKVLDFYINVLGLKPERLEEFKQGKVKFPSVRINADTIIDLFPKGAKPVGSVPFHADLNHFCLVIEKKDIAGFIEHLKKHEVLIEDGPGEQWGSHGIGMSIYFRDPENRQIEVRYYDKD